MEDFHFHERDAFISLYPQGYHKTDKSVSGRCRGVTVSCILFLIVGCASMPA